MTSTSSSKLGKILHNPTAAEVLFAAAPELKDSPHLDFVQGLSLDRLAGYTHRDRAWLDGLVRALAAVPDDRVQTFEVPAEEMYRFEVIDTWNMTVEDADVHPGTFRVELPGRPYMAIRIQM